MPTMATWAIYGVNNSQDPFTTVILILSAICISDFYSELRLVTTEYKRHLSISVPLGAALLRLPTELSGVGGFIFRQGKCLSR